MAIVTLTSDFGHQDGYVGAMKGVLLSMCPGVTIVDLAHGIAPGDVAGGAFALAQATGTFPAGTIHVAVVDPGVGGDRAAVIVEAGGQRFVGPDNGLLTLAARAPRRAWRIERRAFRREPTSSTFHGRDVFAAAAARLAAGWSPEEAGPPVDALVELPRADGASVAHVDRFGNVVTFLPAATWSEGTWTVGRGGARGQGVRTYADVAPGELLVYVGSSGLVEVAVRDGSAAELLGVRVGDALPLGRDG